MAMDGVEVTVEAGLATVRFSDRSKRAAVVGKLIASGGPQSVEYLSIDYPYPAYRVPEGNAREAGLLPDAAPKKAATAPVADADVPGEAWTRAELDEYALDKRGLDTTHLRSKAEVLAALAEPT